MMKDEGRLYALFSAMSEGVALHEIVYDNSGQAIDYRILEVNPAFEKQTGIPSKQVVGKLASEAYGTGSPPFLEIYEKVASSQEPTRFEQYFAPLNKHFIISVFSPGRNQFATVFSDISAIKLAEQKIESSEARYRTLFEGAGDYVLVLKPSDETSPVIIDVNRSACEKFGYSRSELLGKQITFLDKNPIMEAAKERTFLLLTQGKMSFEIEHIRKDGTTFWANALVKRVTISGENLFYSVEHDITARKRSEHELSVAMKMLAEKEKAKSRFLAAAGHDLRQPLAAASLFIDALKIAETDSEKEKIIERLTLTMKNFDDLLDSLLKVSKLDAGVIKPEYSLVSLEEIFSWIHDTFMHQALEHHLRFKLYFPLNKTIKVRSDIGLLKSALVNLISNAIKFTSKGGLLVSARQRGSGVLFQVWDTGDGIPDQAIDRVFDEFFQVGNPQRDRTRGLGLGLSIAKRSLALINGELTCRSHVGRGSVFQFILPIECNLSQYEANSPTYSTVPKIDIAKAFVHGKHFVVVEDDLMVSEALGRSLELMGGKVKSFTTAESALQHPDSLIADCYIVDYMLAGELDGFDFLFWIQRKLNKPVCAVIMSGDTSSDFIRQSERFDCPVIHKPANIERLISSLAEQQTEMPPKQ